MQLIFLLEQVVNGLVLGGYYLLLALGPVADLQRRRHRQPRARRVLCARAPTCRSRSRKHLGFGAGVVMSPVVVGLLGILFERFLLRRFYTADPILSLLVTFGLAHGGRAGDPHDLGRGAAAVDDAAGVQGQRDRWATSCSRATGCSCSAW